MTTRTVVTGAAVVCALGIGAILGSLVPRDDAQSRQPAQAADPGLPAAWLDALAPAAVDGRLDGLGVMLLVDANADDAAVDAVTEALNAAGAAVVGQATLGSDWSDPQRAGFRAELVQQFEASVPGFVADQTSGSPLDGAIATALLGTQSGTDQAGSEAAADEAGTDTATTDTANAGASELTTASLLRSLEAAGLVADVRAPAATPGAVVLIAAATDAGSVQSVLAMRAWERALAAVASADDGGGAEGAGSPAAAGQVATAVVLGTPMQADAVEAASAAGTLGETDPPAPAAKAIASAASWDVGERPSIVVAGPLTLVAPQLVGAIREQLSGGAGAYGAFAGLELIAAG